MEFSITVRLLKYRFSDKDFESDLESIRICFSGHNPYILSVDVRQVVDCSQHLLLVLLLVHHIVDPFSSHIPIIFNKVRHGLLRVVGMRMVNNAVLLLHLHHLLDGVIVILRILIPHYGYGD